MVRSPFLLAIAAILAATPGVGLTTPVAGTVVAPSPAVPDPVFDEVASDLEAQGGGFRDPLEGLNRRTNDFNQVLDRWLLDPITTVYRFVVPEAGRRGVRNVLSNVNTPATLVNDLLQLEIHDAGVTTVRFLINTTVGVGGVFDVGKAMGVPGHRSDFGQTLARYGVSSGPFLIIPVLGPSTPRDGAGLLVDFLFRPTTYLLAGTDQFFVTTIHGGSSGLAAWDSETDNLKTLETTSVDYYAALRSAYYQHRAAEISGRDDVDETAEVAAR